MRSNQLALLSIPISRLAPLYSTYLTHSGWCDDLSLCLFASSPGPSCPAQLVRLVPPHEEAWRGEQNTCDSQQSSEFQVFPPSPPPHQHQQHPDDGHTGPGVHPVHRHQRYHEHVLWLPHHGHGQSCLPAQYRLWHAGGQWWRRRRAPQRLLPA